MSLGFHVIRCDQFQLGSPLKSILIEMKIFSLVPNQLKVDIVGVGLIVRLVTCSTCCLYSLVFVFDGLIYSQSI